MGRLSNGTRCKKVGHIDLQTTDDGLVDCCVEYTWHEYEAIAVRSGVHACHDTETLVRLPKGLVSELKEAELALQKARDNVRAYLDMNGIKL